MIDVSLLTAELREFGRQWLALAQAQPRAKQQETELLADASAVILAEKIVSRVRALMAAELDRQSQHYWDMASMFERTRATLDTAGEESGAMVAETTLQVCRDVAKRLKQRAAEITGDTVAEAMEAAPMVPPRGEEPEPPAPQP